MPPAKEDLFSLIVRDVQEARSKAKGRSAGSDPAAQEDKEPATAVTANVAAQTESYALVVGMPGAGKSSLLNVYLNPNNKEETPRPTVALEYMFARRSAGITAPKDVAHVWELGGGLPAADLVKVPITANNFRAACYVIVLDLSKPADVLPALLFWTDQIKACVKPLVRELGKADPAFAEGLKARTFAKFGKGHPDARAVKPCPVPLVVVGAKYDIFRGFESARRRVVAQALRFVAHVNGASLVFCSTRDKQLRDAFRLVMNAHLFRSGAGAAAVAKRPPETHPEKALFVSAGEDSFEAILKPLPAGTARAEFISAENSSVPEGAMGKWRQAIAEFFGPATENAAAGSSTSTSTATSAAASSAEGKEDDGGGGGGDGWPEPAVDELRAQKDEALRRYRREAERRARMERREQADRDREADEAAAAAVSGRNRSAAAAAPASAAAAAPAAAAAGAAEPAPVRRKSSGGRK